MGDADGSHHLRIPGDVTELVVRPIEAYDTVPLKSKVVRRRWGNKGEGAAGTGPTDNARGGR